MEERKRRRREMLIEAFRACRANFNCDTVSVRDMAAYSGKCYKTITRYIDENAEEFEHWHGICICYVSID